MTFFTLVAYEGQGEPTGEVREGVLLAFLLVATPFPPPGSGGSLAIFPLAFPPKSEDREFSEVCLLVGLGGVKSLFVSRDCGPQSV